MTIYPYCNKIWRRLSKISACITEPCSIPAYASPSLITYCFLGLLALPLHVIFCFFHALFYTLLGPVKSVRGRALSLGCLPNSTHRHQCESKHKLKKALPLPALVSHVVGLTRC